MSAKYVAYVCSNTNLEGNKGLTIFDVDAVNGTMVKRCEYEANNASYCKLSKDKKYLYVVVDEGVQSYRILEDGNLEYMNTASIRGLRGCYIDIYKDNKFMFIAGMYDGKATVLRINEDRSVGEITQNYYNKGMGSVAETNAVPHITCVKPTPDEKFVCVVDAGMNQIKVMDFDDAFGTMHMHEMVHCEQESAPRMVLFDSYGKFMYVVFGKKCYIKVYEYECINDKIKFEEIQKIDTLRTDESKNITSLAMRFSPDEKYLLCSNGGDNSVCVFERDKESGMLKKLCVLPISGAYPIDMGMLPDTNIIFSVNNEEETVTFFRLTTDNIIKKWNKEENSPYFSMTTNPVKVPQPNCMRILKLEEADK